MTRKRTFFYSGFFCTFVLGMLIFAYAANAATQSATFTTSTYPFLGNNHIAADLNGDGKLDLAGTGANSAAIMLGKGDGTFQAKIEYPVGGQAQHLAAGDFNSDGKLDVVIMHSIACFTAPCTAAETISVMLGNGDGTFQPTRELAAGQHMHWMTAGDFNRDGIKDLAIGAENTQLYILLGVGDGTFVQQPPMTLIPGGDLFSASNDVDVADFNRDTIQDLVVALGNGHGNVVLLGNGDGTFRQSFQITENAVSAPLNLAVADFNGDGFQDIARAMGNGNLGLMEIANGNGDGTFQAPVRYLVPPSQSSIGGIFITASDFNGDGKPDVALAVGGASTALYVLKNSTGTTAADTVAIQRAEYTASKAKLRVDATSTNSSAVLKCYVTSTDALVGTLTNNGGGKYSGQFSWPSNPQSITVRSSFGGQATRTVTRKQSAAPK